MRSPPAGLGAAERCWRERLVSCGLLSRSSANCLRFDCAVLCAGEVLPAAAALACSLARIAAALSSPAAATGAAADDCAGAGAGAPFDAFDQPAEEDPHESALAAGDPHGASLAGGAGETWAAAPPPPPPAPSKGRGYWWR